MDADDVAGVQHLHQSGKVRHFGVSNFTPAQFTLLQSRLPFTTATNRVEISPVHQPLLLDGTLDQLQQLRIRPITVMSWRRSAVLMMRLISRCAGNFPLSRKNSTPVLLNRWSMHGFYVCRRSRAADYWLG